MFVCSVYMYILYVHARKLEAGEVLITFLKSCMYELFKKIFDCVKY